jgi:hypothetical protein
MIVTPDIVTGAHLFGMAEEETDYLKCIQAQGVPGDWHG